MDGRCRSRPDGELGPVDHASECSATYWEASKPFKQVEAAR